MTLLRSAIALSIAALLAACTYGEPMGTTPVGAPPDPMSDAGLSSDPMNPGGIDDSIGTQI